MVNLTSKLTTETDVLLSACSKERQYELRQKGKLTFFRVKEQSQAKRITSLPDPLATLIIFLQPLNYTRQSIRQIFHNLATQRFLITDHSLTDLSYINDLIIISNPIRENLENIHKGAWLESGPAAANFSNNIHCDVLNYSQNDVALSFRTGLTVSNSASCLTRCCPFRCLLFDFLWQMGSL